MGDDERVRAAAAAHAAFFGNDEDLNVPSDKMDEVIARLIIEKSGYPAEVARLRAELNSALAALRAWDAWASEMWTAVEDEEGFDAVRAQTRAVLAAHDQEANDD